MLDWIRQATEARDVRQGERLMSLWSGYGEILRVHLSGAEAESAVVKVVDPPTRARHPRGWQGKTAHARKLRSYAVEHYFYTELGSRAGARIARCYGATESGGRRMLLLEDLDAAGFAGRRRMPSDEELNACLDWLAKFHAAFMGVTPNGLWEEGAYWHLDTRPDELAAMEAGPLKDAAPVLDHALRSAKHRTLVHGDAKLANFCFSEEATVAALDFQYVGGGAGIKDIAYLLSCLDVSRCEAHADSYLDCYFRQLRVELAARHGHIDASDVEAEWRGLYQIAWADFSRFLSGWAPEHRKLDRYAAAMTEQALHQLGR